MVTGPRLVVLVVGLVITTGVGADVVDPQQSQRINDVCSIFRDSRSEPFSPRRSEH